MRLLVNVDVPDVAEAAEFYGAALGLKLSRTLEQDVAELVGASSVVYLLQHPAGSQPVRGLPGMRDYARHWTPVHLDFVVNDLEAAARRASAAGAIQESGCIAWCGSRCISFSDPFGHGFCLIQFEDETYGSDDG